MPFSSKEEKIILQFYKNIGSLKGRELTLFWEKATVTALFDTVFEDLDDDTEEEFISFSFKCLFASGNAPIEITQDEYFIVNYRNFPLRIECDEKIIS